MKHKIRFIFPRLVGLTVVAGLLSFVIGIIFKLLVAGTLVAAIGTWVLSRMRRERMLRTGVNPSAGPSHPMSTHGIPVVEPIVPRYPTQAAIVPIY